jgi:hypothetical protein
MTKEGENIFKLGNEFDEPKLRDEKIGRRANFGYVKNWRTDTEWENEEKRKWQAAADSNGAMTGTASPHS